MRVSGRRRRSSMKCSLTIIIVSAAVTSWQLLPKTFSDDGRDRVAVAAA